MFTNQRKKRFVSGGLAVLMLALSAGALFAHDEGHAPPKQLPPVGPHGGKYAKLERHYGEVVVRGSKVMIYILEPDVKYVAEDASKVTAAYEVPGKVARKQLTLNKKGEGYEAEIAVPPGSRRIVFTIGCELDGIAESGTVQYEPKR